ncbi:c-type cytochrome [Shewanella marina]|uniref:c-type cytochrome n=1 Tax=Shewanella marina TaxID=487319 RepID=UPI0004710DE9|nr:c-type cytochrome [Shewanella marina]
MNKQMGLMLICALPFSALANETASLNTALEKLNTEVPATLMAHEVNISQGEKLAQTRCIACHSKTMLTMMPNYPSLYGQKPAYLIKTLLDFKQGKRQDPIMQMQAASLSDANIKDVAWYYSQQPPLQLNK